MNIGQYIKKLRIDKGLTQEEVGTFVGVQRAAVQKWESGMTQNIKRNVLQKLAELFGVPASSFIAEIVIDNSNENNSVANAPFAAYGKNDTDFTKEEVQKINTFIDFVRSQREEKGE